MTVIFPNYEGFENMGRAWASFIHKKMEVVRNLVRLKANTWKFIQKHNVNEKLSLLHVDNDF